MFIRDLIRKLADVEKKHGNLKLGVLEYANSAWVCDLTGDLSIAKVDNYYVTEQFFNLDDSVPVADSKKLYLILGTSE